MLGVFVHADLRVGNVMEVKRPAVGKRELSGSHALQSLNLSDRAASGLELELGAEGANGGGVSESAAERWAAAQGSVRCHVVSRREDCCMQVPPYTGVLCGVIPQPGRSAMLKGTAVALFIVVVLLRSQSFLAMCTPARCASGHCAGQGAHGLRWDGACPQVEGGTAPLLCIAGRNAHLSLCAQAEPLQDHRLRAGGLYGVLSVRACFGGGPHARRPQVRARPPHPGQAADGAAPAHQRRAAQAHPPGERPRPAPPAPCVLCMLVQVHGKHFPLASAPAAGSTLLPACHEMMAVPLLR